MNENILEYRGYYTKIEYSVKDHVLYGKIEGIRDLVNFESESIEAIEQEFHQAVDDYLTFCEDLGQTPEKTYKGVFNVRITPELHREAAIAADKNGKTLNAFVADAIDQAVHGKSSAIIYSVRIPSRMLSRQSQLQEERGVRHMSKIKIQERRITDFSFHVDPNLKTIQLKAEFKASFGKAMGGNTLEAQIIVHADIHADCADDFSLAATECFTLTFEEEPADLKETLESLFQDVCLDIVYEDIDKALRGLGKAPLHLKEGKQTRPDALKEDCVKDNG